MKRFLLFFASLAFFSFNALAQDMPEEDSVEVYLIDSYITPETPHKFILSYFTSEACKSAVVLDKKHEITVSDTLTESHKAEIPLDGYEFDSTSFQFTITVENEAGEKFRSERYEVSFPTGYNEKVGKGQNLFVMCCIGGTIFGIPSVSYVRYGEKDYFSLTKEVPLFSIYGKTYNYPVGYFGVEYTYIFDAPVRNYFRFGYKHIIQVPGIEYISPGISGFTSFTGANGFSPEISVGLFKIYNLFTLYGRYRYNNKPGDKGYDFHEVSIGLYSGFFTFHF